MSLARVLAQLSTGGGLPKRFRPFANQAANEAFLRFAPEWDQLNAVREQSAQTLRQNVGQANSAAQLISALANQSQQTLNSSQSPLVQRLAAYDNAPANSSAAVVAQNLGLTHDAASSMLAQAASNAPLRAQQQGLQALTAHQQDLGKINAQRASLAGQVGAFTQGRLGDLVQTDRKDRAALSKSIRDAQTRLATAGLDPTTGLYDPARNPPPKPPKGPSTIAKPPANFTGSEADWNGMTRAQRDAWASLHGKPGDIPNPSGIPLAPPATQTAQVAKINGAGANIKQLMSHPQAVKSEVEALLRAGKVDGVKYTQDQIDVAFDLYRNRGRVSNRGAHKLHTMGVSVHGHFRPAPKRSGVSLGLGASSVPLPNS